MELLEQLRDSLVERLLSNPEKLFESKKFLLFFTKSHNILKDYIPANNQSICCLFGESRVITKNCQNVKYLSKKNNKVSVTLPDGKQLFVKFYDNEDIDFTVSTYPSVPLKNVKNISVSSCMFPINFYEKYIELNDYLCDLFIGIILSTVYKKQDVLKGIVNYYGGATCVERNIITDYYSDLFFNITIYSESKNIGGTEYSGVKKDFFINILKQVVANLLFLQQFGFNHGELYINNLQYLDEDYRFEYQGIKGNSDFVIKITNFKNSSMTINTQNGPYRLYNYDLASKAYLQVFSFKPSINKKYYVVDTLMTKSSYAVIRHMGIPFYISFDMYTLLISLYLNSDFLNTVLADEELYTKFFYNIWANEKDVDKIYNELVKNLDKQNFDIIVDILTGVNLRCDLMEYLKGELSQI